MPVQFLVILSRINDTNLDEKKVNHKLQRSWHIATSSSIHKSTAIFISQRRTHDPGQFVAGSRFLMLLHFQRVIGKGHASKPEAR